MGLGGAGIFTISMILVLQLASDKRRGLFIGLINAGYTAGVAMGAVIAGALAPKIGWVSHLPRLRSSNPTESNLLDASATNNSLWRVHFACNTFYPPRWPQRPKCAVDQNTPPQVRLFRSDSYGQSLIQNAS
jgi:MFS family permease